MEEKLIEVILKNYDALCADWYTTLPPVEYFRRIKELVEYDERLVDDINICSSTFIKLKKLIARKHFLNKTDEVLDRVLVKDSSTFKLLYDMFSTIEEGIHS